MKTVLTQPTALKGLLLLALIANLSHGSSTFKASSITQTTNMSSVTDREPAQAAPADASTPAVGVGTSAPLAAPARVLTAKEKADLAAKRKSLRAGRPSQGPIQKDDLTALEASNPPPGAKPTAPVPPAAPVVVKVASQPPRVTVAPAPVAPPVAPVKLVVAPAPVVAPVPPAKPAPLPETQAARESVAGKPTTKVVWFTKTVHGKRVRVKKIIKVAAKPNPAPAPAPFPATNTTLAAEVCTTGECQRQAGIDKVAKKLAEFYTKLSDAQAKNWIDCSNGDKAACDAYALAASSAKPGETAQPAPFPSKGEPDKAAPEVTDAQKLKSMTEDFVAQARSLHSSTNKDLKDKIEARMSDLSDGLYTLIHDMYQDQGNRSIADDSIVKITSAMMGAPVSSSFQMRQKINSLRSIKPGYQLKDLADKTSARMDSASDELREAQNRLTMATSTYEANVAERDLIMKRQGLMTIDQEFTRSASSSMSRLQTLRSDINAADYAAYTSSYQQVQSDFQTLISPQSSTNGQTGIQGQQQQPNIFGAQGTTTNFAQQSQFGSTTGFGNTNGFGTTNGFSSTNGVAPFGSTGQINNTAAMMGIQPIQAIPFTGVNTGINSGITAMPFANTTGLNTGINQYSVAPFASTSAFGGCQTSQVYNGYMPTQPTCLASNNYTLSNQSQFGNGLQPFRSPMTTAGQSQYRPF